MALTTHSSRALATDRSNTWCGERRGAFRTCWDEVARERFPSATEALQGVEAGPTWEVDQPRYIHPNPSIPRGLNEDASVVVGILNNAPISYVVHKPTILVQVNSPTLIALAHFLHVSALGVYASLLSFA